MPDAATAAPKRTSPPAKKRRAAAPSTQATAKRRRKPASDVGSAVSSVTIPQKGTVTPAKAASLYANAMDDARQIGARYAGPKRARRAEIARLRGELAAALMDARQNRSIDSLAFELPEGGACYLTFKTNTTYGQVTRAAVEAALRSPHTVTAAVAAHEAAPTKTLRECVVEGLVAALKFALQRTSTQPAFTKGPPTKSKVSDGAPVIHAASADLHATRAALEAKRSELKSLLARQKAEMEPVHAAKAKHERLTRKHLAPLKSTQDAVEFVKLGDDGMPVRIERCVLRMRRTKPRKAAAVTVKKLERALPLEHVTSGLSHGDVVAFSSDDVRASLAGSREAVMRAYDLAHAKYVVVQAIKARATAGKSVLRLARARSCHKKAP